MTLPQHSRRPSLRSTRAFTLVEIMVVVVIIGLLAALGLPALRQSGLKAKSSAVANDLRVFSAAFSTFALQRGKWPAEAAPGVIPAEMADALPAGFTRPAPIGGYYDWVQGASADGLAVTAALVILTANGSVLSDDAELFEMIDRTLDDGDLSTGLVQIGSTNSLVFIIEP